MSLVFPVILEIPVYCISKIGISDRRENKLHLHYKNQHVKVFTKIIAVCCKKRKKPINTPCGNSEGNFCV